MSVAQKNPFIPPDELTPPDNRAAFRPKAVQQWLNDLPVANVGKAAQELYQLTRQLNRVALSVDDRFQIMEMLHPILTSIVSGLEHNYLNRPLPLAHRDQRIAELGQFLRTMLIVGYKLVLLQQREPSLLSRLTKKQYHSRCLQRIFYYLGQILLNDYRIYQQSHAHLWHEIHGIYRYALKLDLHHRPLPDPTDPNAPAFDLTHHYKCLLLLALANPFRLQQGQVDKIYLALNQWAPLCELVDGATQTDSKALFAVEKNSDNPPTYRNNLTEHPVEGLWLFDTNQLSAELEQEVRQQRKEQLMQQRPKHHVEVIPNDILHHLSLAWGSRLQRRDQRLPVSGHVRIIRGLSPIYNLLGGVPIKEPPGRPPKQQPSKRTPAMRHEVEATSLNSTSWGFDSPRQQPAHELISKPIEQTLSRQQQVELSTESQIDLCDIYDQSNGGYHLGFSPGEAETTARVGDLIGVQQEDAELLDKGSWNIGAIRWLRAKSQGGIAFGVEVFADWAEPVIVEHLRAETGHTEQWCALLLFNRSTELKSLLLPMFYAHTDDEFILLRRGKRRAFRVSYIIQTSSAFMHVQFKFPRQTTKPTEGGGESPEPPRKEVDEGHFDDLWNQI